MHNTKNMAIELLCSASTAFDSWLGVDETLSFFDASPTSLVKVVKLMAALTITGVAFSAGGTTVGIALALLTLCVVVRFVPLVIFTSQLTVSNNHNSVREQINMIKIVLVHLDQYLPIANCEINDFTLGSCSCGLLALYLSIYLSLIDYNVSELTSDRTVISNQKTNITISVHTMTACFQSLPPDGSTFKHARQSTSFMKRS